MLLVDSWLLFVAYWLLFGVCMFVYFFFDDLFVVCCLSYVACSSSCLDHCFLLFLVSVLLGVCWFLIEWC